MSFFDGEVIAKEQLPGAIGHPSIGVVVPPIIPDSSPLRGGTIPGRKPSPLSLIITPDGQVLLNLDIQKRRN